MTNEARRQRERWNRQEKRVVDRDRRRWHGVAEVRKRPFLQIGVGNDSARTNDRQGLEFRATPERFNFCPSRFLRPVQGSLGASEKQSRAVKRKILPIPIADPS